MLRPVLAGVDHLILAGDIWQQRLIGLGGEAAKRLLKDLLEMLDELGISHEVLRGNHDPKGGAGVTWLANREVLVTHGDAIYDDATPWSRQIGKYREEVSAIIQRFESRSHLAAACADRAKEIAQTLNVVSLPKIPPPFNFFATALWPPSRTFEMLRVWNEMGRGGLRFLEHSGEGAKVLVCGHFHRAGIWERRGKVMINTGAFMKGSRPWAVDLHEGMLTASALRLSDGSFVMGEVKGRWILRE
jgi:predicted phosphodiesterase